MKIIVIVLCLIPTVAFGGELVKLHFTDKHTNCGEYSLKGDKYCKSIGGGDVCWNKADVASVEKVDECEQMGYAQGNNPSAGMGSLRKNPNYVDYSDPEWQKQQAELLRAKKAKEEDEMRTRSAADWEKRKAELSRSKGLYQ